MSATVSTLPSQSPSPGNLSARGNARFSALRHDCQPFRMEVMSVLRPANGFHGRLTAENLRLPRLPGALAMKPFAD